MLLLKWVPTTTVLDMGHWLGALAVSAFAMAFSSSVAMATPISSPPVSSTEETLKVYSEIYQTRPPMEERMPSEQTSRILQQLVNEAKETGVCQGKTLTVQCFGNQDCRETEALTRIALEPFARSTGLRLRPIYRIWESESLFYQLKNGEHIPQNMRSVPISATMFYHTDPERACATTLAIAVGITARDIGTHERRQVIVPVEPVTPNMGSPGFIEFWWSMLP